MGCLRRILLVWTIFKVTGFFSTLIGPIKRSRTGVAVVVIFYITVKNSEYLRRMKRLSRKVEPFSGFRKF